MRSTGTGWARRSSWRWPAARRTIGIDWRRTWRRSRAWRGSSCNCRRLRSQRCRSLDRRGAPDHNVAGLSQAADAAARRACYDLRQRRRGCFGDRYGRAGDWSGPQRRLDRWPDGRSRCVSVYISRVARRGRLSLGLPLIAAGGICRSEDGERCFDAGARPVRCASPLRGRSGRRQVGRRTARCVIGHPSPVRRRPSPHHHPHRKRERKGLAQVAVDADFGDLALLQLSQAEFDVVALPPRAEHIGITSYRYS